MDWYNCIRTPNFQMFVFFKTVVYVLILFIISKCVFGLTNYTNRLLLITFIYRTLFEKWASFINTLEN